MDEILRRLRERKLVQWGLAYVAAGFAALQGVDIVAQRFGWPESIERGLIIAIVVGFFVTIVLAWYHGERGVQRATGAELLILALLLAIGGGFLWRVAQTSRETSATAGADTSSAGSNGSNATKSAVAPLPDDKSIAVLPFANLSEEKANAYFAEGMQDEILTRLAQIGSLRVSSRTSTEQFASKPGNITEIARQLGVANVLEGSVAKAANRVHINVQLIRAADNTHLWAEIYDRTLDDIFGVQGEVSKAIADKLGAKLSGREQEQITAIPTRNEAAYDAWLRGLTSYYSGFQNEQYLKSVQALREAVTADPNFAQAWAMLARVDGILYFFGLDRTQQHLDAINAALANAERLAPDLYETKAARAYYVYRVEENYAEAIKLFQALHAIRPSDTEALITLAFISGRQGHIDVADDYIAQAVKLEPLNVRFYKLQAASHTYAHRPGEAIKILDRVQEIQPGERESIIWRGSAYLALGDFARAAEILDLSRLQEGESWEQDIELLRNQRNFAPAIAWLENASGTKKITPEDAVDARVCLADLKHFAGDAAGAKAEYQQARDAARASIAKQKSNGPMKNTLALAEAGLGNANAALAALDSAAADLDKSGDVIERGRDLDTRARVYAKLGRKDEAIDTLRQVLTAYYGGTTCTQTITTASLGLDPEFDGLRGDPRFQALEKPASATATSTATAPRP
jgi:TolB-like protein